MANVDTLIVRIEADMRGLRRDLASVQRQSIATTKRMGQGFKATQASTVALGSSLGRLKGVLAGLGIAIFGRSLIKANSEMEDLRSTLNTVFGTAKRGDAAFKFINEFAQKTPFDIQTLSKSFIQLQGAGIQPTNKLLTTLGNAASTTTDTVRTFEAMVQLLQRSMGGGLGIEELEILQNAGIPVFKVLEDTIGKTRGEISEYGQSAEGAAKITQALMDHFDKNAPDAMAKRTNNLSTGLSNLGIAANNALLQMGDAGLNEALKIMVNELSSIIKAAKPVIEVIGRVLGGALKALAVNLKTATIAFTLFIATLAVSKVMSVAFAFIKLSKAALSFGAVIAIVNKAIIRTPLGLFLAAVIATASATGTLDRVLKKFGVDLNDLGGIFGDTAADLNALEDAMNGGGASTAKAKTGLNSFGKTLEQLKEETLDARLELLGLNEAQKTVFAEGLKRGKISILSGVRSAEQVIVTELETGNQLDKINAEIAARDALRATLEEQKRAAENVKSAVADLVTEEDRLLQLQNDLKAAIQSGTGDQEKLKEALEATSQEMFKQSEAGQAVMGAIGSVSASVSSGIADVITNSGKGLKSFKEMFRDITNQIIQQLIKTKIQAMLTSAALSFGGSAFGGGGSSGGGFSLGSIFSGIGSFFGFGGGGGAAPTRAVSTVGFAATGSSAAAGQSFLVGERGPELFTPRSSGMISPNNMMNIAMSGGQRLNGGGGGPNITQNFNVSTGVQQTVRAEVLNLMPLIKQESISAVIDARQRGGSLASGLGA